MSLRESLHVGWGRQLPLVLQTEAAECGLASLAMVASYYGKPSDLVDLRRKFGMSLRGATLKDLVRIADHVGLTSRPLRIELEELRLLRVPCVLHWDLIHFVVLKSAGRNDVVIHDPAFGVRRLTYEQVSKHFTGVALELSPAQGFQPEVAAPRVRLSSMLGNLVGLKRSLGELFVLALAIEIFAIASPLFLQWVVDHALVTADHDLLLVLALGFTLLLLIRVAVSTMRGSMLIALGAQLRVQGRSNLFAHLVNLPVRYFEMRYIGDVMSRFGSQDTILQAISTDVIETVLDGVMATGTLIVMFVFAPTLAAVVLLGAVIYGVVRWASYTPLRQASAEAILWGARRDSHFLETLRGIRTIKLFNGQDGRRNHWLNLLVETTNRQLTTQKMQLAYKTVNSLVIGALAILVVWMGANRVLANTFSVGMLFAFISYKDQFLDRVSSLINKVLDLQMLRLHAERLADVALTAPEPREFVPTPGDGWVRPAAIEVRDLRFRYGESDPWVLDGINCRVEPGEFVAIVGPSGCGKTTLLKVLASLFEPTEGELQVNDAPLAHLGIERYRAMIGVVMQDDQLFAGSIADNICFFAEQPDQERIAACARQAAVHDDIVDMPMGYNTLIGDMGTVLSGGQKQRVLIARALYRQPGILLLDEATSHLDVGRERAVSDALRSSRVTRVIVAHRPETIMSADRIVTIDGGKIVSDRRKGEPGERLLSPMPQALPEVVASPMVVAGGAAPSSPPPPEGGSDRNAAR